MLTEPCRFATTANITLSGLQTVDGIAVEVGDRVLVKNQGARRNNGIYVVTPPPSSWARATDFVAPFDSVEGTFIPVTQGSTNAATLWRLVDTPGPFPSLVVVGTTPLTFERAVSDGVSNGVFFRQPVPRAVTRTAQEKMRDFISVKDFGAVGDGAHDDTREIQAAIDSGANAIYFPEGTYLISAPIYVPRGAGMRLFGAGYSETVLRGSGTFASILRIGRVPLVTTELPLATAPGTSPPISKKDRATVRGTIEDMKFVCEGAGVKYGVYGDQVSHFTFRRIWCIGFREAGISIGYGWCNNFLESEFSSNSGHGLELNIDHLAGGNNAVNIRSCVFLANTKHGIFARSAKGLSIDGCTIEKNEAGGIFLANVEGFTISSYFEANAQMGYPFDKLDYVRDPVLDQQSSPTQIVIKADIILCGAGLVTEMAHAAPCTGGVISSCYVSATYTSVFVYDAGAVECSVRNCVQGYGTSALIAWEYDPQFRGFGWTVENCGGFERIFEEFNGNIDEVFGYKNRNRNSHSERARVLSPSSELPKIAQRRNYANVDFNTWTPLAAGSASTHRKSEVAGLQFWNGLPIWSISSTEAWQSNRYGMGLTTSDYPDLTDKLMWYGIWMYAPGPPGVYAVPYCNQQGFTSDSPHPSNEWIFAAVSFIWPAPDPSDPSSLIVECGIYKHGEPIGDIYFAAPMLMEVGTPMDEALQTIPQLPCTWRGTAAPTAGRWRVGDTVLNSAPGPGAALGWVCTAAGTPPGTWKAMANLAL